MEWTDERRVNDIGCRALFDDNDKAKIKMLIKKNKVLRLCVEVTKMLSQHYLKTVWSSFVCRMNMANTRTKLLIWIICACVCVYVNMNSNGKSNTSSSSTTIPSLKIRKTLNHYQWLSSPILSYSVCSMSVLLHWERMLNKPSVHRDSKPSCWMRVATIFLWIRLLIHRTTQHWIHRLRFYHETFLIILRIELCRRRTDQIRSDCH